MTDWTEHEQQVCDLGAKRASAYIQILEEELAELRKLKGRTTADAVVTILEDCGLDALKAREALWNAIARRKIALDEKRRVYVYLAEEQVRRECDIVPEEEE